MMAGVFGPNTQKQNAVVAALDTLINLADVDQATRQQREALVSSRHVLGIPHDRGFSPIV